MTLPLVRSHSVGSLHGWNRVRVLVAMSTAYPHPLCKTPDEGMKIVKEEGRDSEGEKGGAGMKDRGEIHWKKEDRKE